MAKMQRIKLLLFNLALDVVMDCVGVKSEEFQEDILSNPCIDSDLGFATSVLLTDSVI